MTLIDDTCDGCGSRFDPMGDPLLTRRLDIGPYAVHCATCAERPTAPEGNARHEIEDLWWLRHSLTALVAGADPSKSFRAGMLQALLDTTRPLTNTTDPRTTPRETDEMPEEGDQ